MSEEEVSNSLPSNDNANESTNANAVDDCTSSTESDEDNLEKMLNQKKLIEEQERLELEEQEKIKREYEEYMIDVENNLNIFLTWIKNSLSEEKLHSSFCDKFDSAYRISLFENICDLFNDQNVITDEILFYWKFMVIHLLRTSKKYKYCINDLEIDIHTKNTNLRLVKEKYIFRCFINEEPLCYFKENSNEYYVS